jgi:predicted RNA-binding Zn ribbon-like protein
MVAEAPETAAGTLAAILRSARCQVAPGEPALPAAQIKLRRSIRKQIRQAAGDETFTPAALVDFARSIQQTADRAGLLASGDLPDALATLLNGNVTLASLNASTRALGLLRFTNGVDSPLRRRDA